MVSQVVLIIILTSATAVSSSVSKEPRLAGGVNVSPSDYSANVHGAAAIAVGVAPSLNNSTVVGVFISETTFVTSAIRGAGLLPYIEKAYVGSVYCPVVNPRFDGQVLAQRSFVRMDITGQIGQIDFSSIPSGSLARPALQYGRSPPDPSAECVAFGYSGPGPSTTWQLNSVPVTIIDFITCVSYFGHPGLNSLVDFCAKVLSPPGTGNNSICPGDEATILMCKPWATFGRKIPNSERLRRHCLVFPGTPWCQWLCSVSSNLWPFCPPSDTPDDAPPPPAAVVEAEPWYLGGVLTKHNSANGCASGNGPSLFAFVSNMNFPVG